MLKNNSFTIPLLIGAVFLGLSMILFISIETPQPYLAGLIVAFFAFETAFIFRVKKRKTSRNRW